MGIAMPQRPKEWNSPLAAKLRPLTLDDIVGQSHLLGNGKLLKRMLVKNEYQSTILWGPPGIGKTSLVRALAHDTGSPFKQLNATKATVKDLRKVISDAEKHEHKTFIFIDEIHRWNKSQQDVILPVVEDGTIILFGATTEKPKFAVNSTLLSRCLVMEVKPLSNEELLGLVVRVKDYYKNKQNRKIQISKEAALLLIKRCSGDARKVITVLETSIEILSDDDKITKEHIEIAIPEKHIVFDAGGNEHFDLAHCYQQSIQYSDADAAIYWLAKWIASGEDPAYICRRMLITAFEDCSGNPNAQTVAMAACYATERTGLPECMIAMAQATLEMAYSKRNKAAHNAIMAAMHDVNNGNTIHVPPELRAGSGGYIHAISKKYVDKWHRDVDGENFYEREKETHGSGTIKNRSHSSENLAVERVYAIGFGSEPDGMIHGPTNDLLSLIEIDYLSENHYIYELYIDGKGIPDKKAIFRWNGKKWRDCDLETAVCDRLDLA